MKILIPTAKEMNTNLPRLKAQNLSEPSLKVASTLLNMLGDGLASFHKIRLMQGIGEHTRLSHIVEGKAIGFYAWQLFNGLMYRQMKRTDLQETEIAYLKSHVYITSALYGIINVYTPIAAHRLDFSRKLKVEGQPLKAYWRKYFDEAVAEDELIISLLSAEFETVFSKDIQDKMIRLKFMEVRDGQLKSHSTISKKARGKFLSAMVSQQIETVPELKELSTDGFIYQAHLSDEKTLVFVKI